MSDVFAGSERQRRIRRRARVVAVVVTLGMLLPMVLVTLDAIAR